MLTPLLGITTWAAFLYIGIRARRVRWLLWAAIYAVVFVAGVALGQLPGEDDWLAGLVILSVATGGLVHSLAIRREALARMDGQSVPHETDPVLQGTQEARERRELRARMRKLAADDPEIAREMGLGRAGHDPWKLGLLDLNHAPAQALAQLDSLDEATARRIAASRSTVGGFSSVEDLGIALDLAPETVERLRERAIFLPL